MIQIGIDISSRDENKLATLNQMSKLDLNTAQIYIESGTKLSDLIDYKDIPNVVIHASSEAHGFNYIKGLTDDNKRMIDESLEAAQYLNAKHMVVHPGGWPIEEWKHHERTKEEWAEYIETDRRDQKLAELLTDHIIANKGDTKILIENMPFWSGKKLKHVFDDPTYADISDIKHEDFGVCLDVASVSVSGFSLGTYFSFNPPNGTESVSYNFDIGLIERDEKLYLEYRTADHIVPMLRRYDQMVSGYLEMSPEVLHIRGIGFGAVHKRGYSMEINPYQLKGIVPYLLETGSPLILENRQFENNPGLVKSIRDYVTNFDSVKDDEYTPVILPGFGTSIFLQYSTPGYELKLPLEVQIKAA